MSTHTVTLDITKRTFTCDLLALEGKTAQYTTWEGETLTGTVKTHFGSYEWDGHYPTVHFADGTWARLDHEIVLVD